MTSYSYAFNVDGREWTYTGAMPDREDAVGFGEGVLRAEVEHTKPGYAHLAVFRGEEPLGCWALDQETGKVEWEGAE